MMERDNIVIAKNVGPMNLNPLVNFGAIASRVKGYVQIMK
jgi:hypothetical protein